MAGSWSREVDIRDLFEAQTRRHSDRVSKAKQDARFSKRFEVIDSEWILRPRTPNREAKGTNLGALRVGNAGNSGVAAGQRKKLFSGDLAAVKSESEEMELKFDEANVFDSDALGKEV